jgi:hypothetical protein
VPWADLALHSLALVVYPGALLAFAVGLLAEGARGRVLATPRLAWPPRPRAIAATALRPPIPTTVLLAMLAATQLAIPFNPVSSGEQSVLVAVVAVVGAAWVASARGGPPARPDLAVLAHTCWLIAMIAPAVAAGTMRPAALAAIAVPIQLPVKVGAAVLALLCLPAVLQLVPETRLRTPAVASLALWLPCCGLFASVFMPLAADDVGGVALFAGETAAAAAIALLLAVVVRNPRMASSYWPALGIAAAITVVLAALALLG